MMVTGIFNAIPFGVIKDVAVTFLYTCSGLSSKTCLMTLEATNNPKVNRGSRKDWGYLQKTGRRMARCPRLACHLWFQKN